MPENDPPAQPPVVDVPVTLEAARASLRVRPLGQLPFSVRSLERTVRAPGTGFEIGRHVAGDVYLGPYLELPGGDVPVTDLMVDSWGVERDAVIDLALSTVGAPGEPRPLDELLVFGGAGAASILADPARLDPWSAGRTPVLVVPDIATALVGWVESAASLVLLARVAERAVAGTATPVSVAPLVRVASGWEPFEWPVDAEAAVDRLHHRWEHAHYTLTQEVLRELYRTTNRPYVTATHVLGERGEELVSAASIVEGSENLLPVVDTVVLVRADGSSTPVPYTSLQSIEGLLQRVENPSPPYHLVTRFPTELLPGGAPTAPAATQAASAPPAPALILDDELDETETALAEYGAELLRRVAGQVDLRAARLDDGLGVRVVHPVRGGGALYVAPDRTVLFTASGVGPAQGLEWFREGRRMDASRFGATD